MKFSYFALDARNQIQRNLSPTESYQNHLNGANLKIKDSTLLGFNDGQ